MYHPGPRSKWKSYRKRPDPDRRTNHADQRKWILHLEKINDKILFLGDSITYGGSYIDNKELFSSLAVKNLKNFKSGNAGVNAWGVANIYGLIIESKFLPAKIYVTTLAEDDFYRGLTRMQGVPYYNVKPNFALRELWHFFCYKQNNNRYRNWVSFSDEEEKTYVAEKAVKKLKEIENFLKNKGFKFFLFITPTEEQVVNRIEKDELIHNLLFKYKLIPIYIIDKLEGYCMTAEKKHEIFYDGIHLNKKGHKIWAEIIGVELEKIILN